jgi:hypothetical protein
MQENQSEYRKFNQNAKTKSGNIKWLAAARAMGLGLFCNVRLRSGKLPMVQTATIDPNAAKASSLQLGRRPIIICCHSSSLHSD